MNGKMRVAIEPIWAPYRLTPRIQLGIVSVREAKFVRLLVSECWHFQRSRNVADADQLSRSDPEILHLFHLNPLLGRTKTMKRLLRTRTVGLLMALAFLLTPAIPAGADGPHSNCNCDGGYWICVIHDEDHNITGVVFHQDPDC